MSSAYALTYVSTYEGFGMLIIETMNCHVPCITSNVSSMPEVAESIGLLVDPSKPEVISEAMHTLVYQKEVYENLKENCKSRKEKFSWDKTAKDIYKSILKLQQN